MILRTFGWSFAITAIGLSIAYWYDRGTGLALVAVLAVLEISLSFDNAVVNARVVERMSPFWQKIFLTIGIVVAVFGMRILFPLLVVGISAKLWPAEAFDLAMNEPTRYKEIMHEAYPMIAAFGGMFLLMLFLGFIFEEREDKWLQWLERPLARIGSLDLIAPAVALGVIATVIVTIDDKFVMLASVVGALAYIVINSLGKLFKEANVEEDDSENERSGGSTSLILATGKAAFFLFLYLEVLDASFSFDGVIGSFAITTDPIVIALGLGIGAMYIRSLTVLLVHTGTLNKIKYLEHGAMWAIGALAVFMLTGVGGYHAPEWLTGGSGAVLIIAAVITSRPKLRNKNKITNSDKKTHVHI